MIYNDKEYGYGLVKNVKNLSAECKAIKIVEGPV